MRFDVLLAIAVLGGIAFVVLLPLVYAVSVFRRMARQPGRLLMKLLLAAAIVAWSVWLGSSVGAFIARIYTEETITRPPTRQSAVPALDHR